MSARPRLLAVVHERWAGPGRLVEPLSAALPGLVLDVARPDLGDRLPDNVAAAGYDGLLVFGGTMAGWEDDVAPWLPATRTLLARAVDAGLPTLGICLGSQLLAMATGGVVSRGGAGLEFGVCDLEILTDAAAGDPLFASVLAATGGSATFRNVQWHADAVVELPPEAVLLATGRQYPHQAFRLGPSAWGVQYHPEVTLKNWTAWCEVGAGDLTAAGRDPQAELAAVAAADAELTRLAAVHATAFAAVVAAGPRPCPGTP